MRKQAASQVNRFGPSHSRGLGDGQHSDYGQSIDLGYLVKFLLTTPAGLALALFVLCGPICWTGLAFWAGFNAELWFKAVSFQPQVFVWMPLCAPFIPLLAGNAFKDVIGELKLNRVHCLAFVGLNCACLAIMFLFDLSSPNVMPYEVKRAELTETFESQFLQADRTSHDEEPAEELSEFGKHMASFRWAPASWSLFRILYYTVLILGWSVMFLQITSSIYSVYLCSNATGDRLEKMQETAVWFLGAVIPALPFLILRRINHLNKISLYHIDKLNVLDWYLAILVVVVVIGLLICVHAKAKNIQTAFSVISSLGSFTLFAKPEVAASLMFSGDTFQTLSAIVGLPFVLALFQWPWLTDNTSASINKDVG